jgi:hypothetical protein
MFILKKIALLNDDQLHYGLGYSENTIYTTKILAGAVYNSYSLKIYAQILDDDGAFTIYEFPQNITVTPDMSILGSTIESLINGDSFSSINQILSQGSFLSTIEEFQKVSSILNQQSLSDRVGLNDSSTQFPQMYGPLEKYAGVVPVIKINYPKSLNFSPPKNSLFLLKFAKL